MLMKISKFFSILYLCVFTENCVAFADRLSISDDAIENKLIEWYYFDFSQEQRQEENISLFGEKYLEFTTRKNDIDKGIFGVKVLLGSIDHITFQVAFCSLFFVREECFYERTKFYKNRQDPTFRIGAKIYPEFFKVDIQNSTYFFVFIQMIETGPIKFPEVLVIRKGKKHLEYFISPLLSITSDRRAVGVFSQKQSFLNGDAGMKEFVLDSFQVVKDQIEKNKISFKQIDFDLIENGYIVTREKKDGSIVKEEFLLSEDKSK